MLTVQNELGEVRSGGVMRTDFENALFVAAGFIVAQSVRQTGFEFFETALFVFGGRIRPIHVVGDFPDVVDRITQRLFDGVEAHAGTIRNVR